MEEEAAPHRIQILKSKLEWVVPRSAFNTPEGSREEIVTEDFLATPDSEMEWDLWLYPRSDNDEDAEFVSVYLGASNITDPVRVNYTLGLIDSVGIQDNLRFGYDKIFSSAGDGQTTMRGFSRFIRRDVLLDPNEEFFQDDKLTIFCDIEVHWDLDVQVSECTFRDGLSGILDSGKFSDAVLVVGGEEIKVHKNVLAAGSPVFAAMFEHDMIESQTGRVEIKDLDVTCVKALLRFIYSGKVDLTGIAEQMLPVADKYRVDRLKTLCEREICKNLTVENVAEKLSFAELHNARKLKVQAMNFIISNKTEVVKQRSFWDLNNADQDLFEEVVDLSFLLGNEQHDNYDDDYDGPPVKRRRLNQYDEDEEVSDNSEDSEDSEDKDGEE